MTSHNAFYKLSAKDDKQHETQLTMHSRGNPTENSIIPHFVQNLLYLSLLKISPHNCFWRGKNGIFSF